MSQNASILAPYGLPLITYCTTDDDNTEMEECTPPSQVDSSSLAPNICDTTMGIQQLKDAAAEVQLGNNQKSTTQIGGVAVNKSCTIAQHFCYITLASSTDRLHHVAQESCFKPTGCLGKSISGNTHINGPYLSILQLIVTLVFYQQQPFLCITEVNRLFLDCEPVDKVALPVLSEKITQVSYQALRLVPASISDDPDGMNDW
ncbi:hypothetical protein BC826DRAFT_972831 [Russula brevipes]|nr:hypothetical protein BC826DRAFT_972831 [Russula brevipes]